MGDDVADDEGLFEDDEDDEGLFESYEDDDEDVTLSPRAAVVLGCSILVLYTALVFVVGVLVGVWYGLNVFTSDRDDDDRPELLMRGIEGPWRSRGPLIDDEALIEEARDAWWDTVETSDADVVLVLWAGVVAGRNTVVLESQRGEGDTQFGGDVVVLEEGEDGFEVITEMSSVAWWRRGPLIIGSDLVTAEHLLLPPEVLAVFSAHRDREGEFQEDELSVVDGILSRRPSDVMCDGALYEMFTDSIEEPYWMLLDIKPSESHGPMLVHLVGSTQTPLDRLGLARVLLAPESCGGDEDGVARGLTVHTPLGSTIQTLTMVDAARSTTDALPAGTLHLWQWMGAPSESGGVIVWVPEDAGQPVAWLTDTGTSRVWSLDLPGHDPVVVIVTASHDAGGAPYRDVVVTPDDRLLARLPTAGGRGEFILLEATGPDTTISDETEELYITLPEG